MTFKNAQERYEETKRAGVEHEADAISEVDKYAILSYHVIHNKRRIGRVGKQHTK